MLHTTCSTVRSKSAGRYVRASESTSGVSRRKSATN